MRDDKAPIIPVHLHPGFQDHQRVNELRTALLAETLAFTQMALDNATGPAGASRRAEKILACALALLEEARDRLVFELL